jgi:hypothetical protein
MENRKKLVWKISAGLLQIQVQLNRLAALPYAYPKRGNIQV